MPWRHLQELTVPVAEGSRRCTDVREMVDWGLRVGQARMEDPGSRGLCGSLTPEGGGDMVEMKNVFISHIHEDDSKLAELKDLVSANGVAVRDSSINSAKPNEAQDPEYIKYKVLAPQIDWASTLVVFVSANTKDSPWVNWEIEYAARQGKRIVGVWERGESGCELPTALEEYYDALVGWHGNSIVDAIVGDVDRSENPDGSSRPVVPLKRHPC
jgi:hypothetical protein